MKVRVGIFASLREKLGWSMREVEVEGPVSLDELLDKIPELKKTVCRGGELDRDFIVLINGVNVRFLGELKAIVRPGDEVSIFPPGGGG